VIASSQTDDAPMGLNGLDNAFDGAFSSAGDGFETYRYGISGAIRLALGDDGAARFTADTPGIARTPLVDTFFVAASIYGDASQMPFELIAGEDGSRILTLASGGQDALDDPLTLQGTNLASFFQTFDAAMTGQATEPTLKLTAQTDGGSEALALRKIEAVAGGAAFDFADTPVHQHSRKLDLFA